MPSVITVTTSGYTRHPTVARAAYGSREFFRHHPEYLNNAYHYRRYAVRNRHMHEARVRHMYDRRDHYRTWTQRRRPDDRDAVHERSHSERDRKGSTTHDRGQKEAPGKDKGGSRDDRDRNQDRGGPAYRDRPEQGRSDHGKSDQKKNDDRRDGTGNGRR